MCIRDSGRRDQIIKFFPVYQFEVSGQGGADISVNQSIVGNTTKASGIIARVDGNVLYVRLKTSQFFEKGEGVTLSDDTALTAVVVDSNPTQLFFDIADAATITARNPVGVYNTVADGTEAYYNIITGKSIVWNSKTQELTVRVDAQPIGNDYTSRIIDSSEFTRAVFDADGATAQQKDIFRVGDFIMHPDADETNERAYLEVGTITYTNGTEFVAENTSKNGSATAKYVTKEIAINSPATSIDVHLLANVKDIADVKVLYRFKKASSQENFEDIDWVFFNEDGMPDTAEIATSENTISGVVEKQSAYQDLKYSVADLPEFSSFAIKIVMASVDPAFVPKIQDIRAVASF